jgi:hypothetical protein
MTRIVVSILYAFLLGSILIASELKEDNLLWGEDEAAALIGTIFLSLNVVGTTGEQIKDTSQISFLTPLFTRHDIIFCVSNDDGHPSCEASA